MPSTRAVGTASRWLPISVASGFPRVCAGRCRSCWSGRTRRPTSTSRRR
jgi:hypothetical protein